MALPEAWRKHAAPDEFVLEGAGKSPVRLTWYGVAAIRLDTPTLSLYLDPFVTRSSLFEVVSRPLRPDPKAIDRHLPPADVIALGHAHYDHSLDVPYLAHRDGSTVIGSTSVGRLLRAAGVPAEQFIQREAEGGRVALQSDDTGDRSALDFVPSRHARVLFGRIPYPGPIDERISLPARASSYRMGAIYAVNAMLDGLRILHLGSADLREEFDERLRADVLCVGVAGFSRTPDYLQRLLGAVRPRLIIPIHWDAFFSPLESPIRTLPNVDARLFVQQCASFAPDATIAALQPGQSLQLKTETPTH